MTKPSPDHQQSWTLTNAEGVPLAVDGVPTLVGFLLARIHEDVFWAENFACDDPHERTEPNAGCRTRVLADCETKRRLIHVLTRECNEWSIRQGTADALLEMLALPYADHADCRPEWRS